MSKDKIEFVGDLMIGHDGELYVITDDGIEHDICEEINQLGTHKHLGDKARVRLIIEKI